MIYALSALVSFGLVFLKGFQQKNVIGHHVKAAFATSYLMAVLDVGAVMIVVKGGVWIALSAGLGASLGMVSAMVLHGRLFRKKGAPE